MTTKRVTYLPTVRELADLPSPSAFEVGMGIWVQDELRVFYTNGVSWVAAPGVQGPQGTPGAPGAPGVDAPQFRGVAYRTTSDTINFTGVTPGDFISSGLSSTIDTAASVDAGDPGAGKFGLKRTGSGKQWCYVVGTADVGAGAPKRLAVKLALNGVPIDASECNASVTATAIAKLHTMYVLELDEDDEVTLWFANYTNANTITVERARMTLIGVR